VIRALQALQALQGPLEQRVLQVIQGQLDQREQLVLKEIDQVSSIHFLHLQVQVILAVVYLSLTMQH
jgi:hypothetical protein